MFIKDPIDRSVAGATQDSATDSKSQDPVETKMDRMITLFSSFSKEMADLKTMISGNQQQADEQHKDIESSVAKVAEDLKANTEKLTGKMDALSVRMNNVEILAGENSNIQQAARQAEVDLAGRVSTLYQKFDETNTARIESTIMTLIDFREAASASVINRPVSEAPPTPEVYSPPTPTTFPTRGLTTPVARSKSERRLSPPNKPITLESAYQMSEMIAQSVADGITEVFDPIGRQLQEVVKSAKKMAKDSFKTPKPSKPTSRTRHHSGDWSPPGSSSSSSNASSSGELNENRDNVSDDDSSSSSNSILRGMEYSTRKKTSKTKGEARRMTVLPPPVTKKARDDGTPTIMYVKPETLSDAIQLKRLTVESVI